MDPGTDTLAYGWAKANMLGETWEVGAWMASDGDLEVVSVPRVVEELLDFTQIRDVEW